MPREKVDLTTCRVQAGVWRQPLPVPWKWAVITKGRRRKYILKKKSSSFPSIWPLGRGNADLPAHRWFSWNNLLVSTLSATPSAGERFWRTDERHQPPSFTSAPTALHMSWDAPWDTVGISWDGTSTLPMDPSPAMTTSHIAGEEAVGWAHTSLAIKVIFLISTSPSHPVTGHRNMNYILANLDWFSSHSGVVGPESHSVPVTASLSNCTEGKIEHHLKGCCPILYLLKTFHNCIHRDEFRVMSPVKRSN